MKALLIDDYAESLYLLQTLLTSKGFTVYTARTGVEGLQILSQEPINLIITDLLMPEMDGFQLCRKVKTDVNYQSIPLIVYTATYTTPEDEALALDLGADAFLIKPMTPEQFLKELDKVIDLQSPTPQKKEDIETTLTEPELAVEEAEYLQRYNVRLIRKLERKLSQLDEANIKLRRSERMFQTVSQSAPVGIFRVENNRQLSYVNERWSAITGIDAEDILTISWLDRVHPEDQERVRLRWEQALTKTEGFACEFRFQHASDKIVWVLARANPLHFEVGNANGFVGIFTDVTREKLLELEKSEIETRLAQSQKLEALGTLVGGVAHDFNNLITTMLGFADLIGRQIPSDSPMVEDLSNLITAGERAKDLISQIQSFSRQRPTQYKSVALGPLLRESLKLFRASSPKGITFEEDIAENLPTVRADVTQIHQILLNLVTNAVYALREKKTGTLTAKLSLIEVDETLRGNFPELSDQQYVCLEISDTGEGIPEEVIQKIYDPFFTTKPPGDGTGMGLSVVHGIIKSHQGAIEVESESDGGTAFRIYLPLAKTQGVVQSLSPLATGAAKPFILSINDDPVLLDLIRRMLQLSDYRTESVSKVAVALEKLGNGSAGIDGVILDLDMPGDRGKQLLATLREHFAHRPILLLSGHPEPAVEYSLTEAELDVLLAKPFTMKAFQHALAAVLHSQSESEVE